MVAGQLEIQLLANLARLQSDMNQAKGMVGNAMQNIESMVASAKSALGALGVGLGVGAFATLVKGSIDAMDRLSDLSKTTRISAEDLAGLGFAAKQSGSDLDATANAINKLAINMAKNGEKFRALGVTAREPIEAFKQLADVTNAILDPQQRAAVLSEALGKSWQQAAPLLAEGSARIGEMVEKGKALSGVTNENVRLADELTDKWGELVGNGGLVNSTLGSMLPLLNKLADDLLKLKGEAGGGGFTFLAEILRVLIVLGGNVAFVLKGIGTEIGGLAAQLAALASGDFARVGEIGRQMKTDAEANRKAFDAWEAGIMAVGTAATKALPVLDATDQVSRQLASSTAAAARAFLTKGESAGKATKAVKDYGEANAHVTQYLKYLVEQERIAQALMEHRVKLMREVQQEEVDAINIRDEVLDRMEDANDALKLEIATLGMTSTARELYLLRLEEERDLKRALDPLDEERIRALYREREALIGVRTEITAGIEAQNQSMDLWGDLYDRVIHNLDDWQGALKDFAKELLVTFGKKYFLQIVSGGGLGLPGLFGGTAGAGNVAAGGTNLFGMLSSLLPGGSTGAAFSSAATSIAQSLGVVNSGILSSIGTVASFVPVVGAVIAGVSALVNLIGSRRGGPKEGGSFLGAFDSSGGVTDITRSLDRSRFLHDETQLDRQAREFVQGIGTSFMEAVRRLGGTANGIQLGLGFNTDPRGTAPSMVSSMVRDASGNLLFNQANRNVGRSDEELQSELQLQSQRALLAALQAADFDDAIDALFETVSADTATLDEINRVLGQAEELRAVVEGLAVVNLQGLDLEALEAMAANGESIGQTFQRVIGSFASFEDQFLSEARRLALASDQVVAAFAAMGVAIPANTDAFYDLVHSLNLANEADRAMFLSLMSIKDAFLIVSQAAAQADDAITEVATTISTDMPGYMYDGSGNVMGGAPSYSPPPPVANMSGLKDYLMGLGLSGLSPLSPQQQLAEARRQYEATVAAAKLGDAAAIDKLPGIHTAYLDLERAVSGGSAYAKAYDETLKELKTIAGIADSPSNPNRQINAALPRNGRRMASEEAIYEVRDVLNVVVDVLTDGIPVVDNQVRRSVENVELEMRSQRRGRLTTP